MVQIGNHLVGQNKVITTLVIRPLDDPNRFDQSVVADLRPLGFGVGGGRGWAQSVART